MSWEGSPWIGSMAMHGSSSKLTGKRNKEGGKMGGGKNLKLLRRGFDSWRERELQRGFF